MSNDIAELTALNRDYIDSVQNSDVRRFDEILAEEFYCSNPDKSLVDRAGFLRQTAVPVTIRNLKAHDVKIRIMDDFAIIHAATRYTLPDGTTGCGPLHRLLGTAEREMARGLGACVAVACVVMIETRRSSLSLPPRSGGEGRPERSDGRGGGSISDRACRDTPHPSPRSLRSRGTTLPTAARGEG